MWCKVTSYRGHVQLTAGWGAGCWEKSPSRHWHWGHGKNRKNRRGLFVAPAMWVIEDPAVHAGKLLPVGQVALEFNSGCNAQFSGRQNLTSLAGSIWWIAVVQISTEFNRVWGSWTLAEKKVFLIIPELSRNFGPKLPVSLKSRILLTHGEMLLFRHERQVEVFGASLLFGDSYKATTAIFNGANSHVCPPRPQGYPCFQNKQ